MGFDSSGGGGGGGGGLEILENGTQRVDSGSTVQVTLSNVTPHDPAFPAAWVEEGYQGYNPTRLAEAGIGSTGDYDVHYCLGWDGNDEWAIKFRADSLAYGLDLVWAVYALPAP
jgi:hypothetical protein